MKFRFKRFATWFLGATGVVSIGQAQVHQSPQEPSKRMTESFRILLRDGFLIQLPVRNSFRINHPLIQATVTGKVESNVSIPELIDSLKTVVGLNVNVREVDILVAAVGTQDFK